MRILRRQYQKVLGRNGSWTHRFLRKLVDIDEKK